MFRSVAGTSPLAVSMIEPGTGIVGGVVSRTVTPKLAVAVWLDELVALQSTMVAPSGKVAPEAGLQVTARPPSTVSVALGGVYVATAPLGPFASATTFAGTPTIVGAESTTVTGSVPVPVQPWASVAVQVIVCAPSGSVSPDWGLQLGVIDPSTRSVAEAVKVTVAPLGLVAVHVWTPETVTFGGVVSTTLTSKLPVVRLPAASVAVQDTGVVPTTKDEPLAGLHATIGDGSTLSVALGAGA
jgi:hypothetical protein